MTAASDTVYGEEAARREAVLRRFEDAWRGGARPDLAGHLPVGGPDRRVLLLELSLLDLEYRWKAGDRATVEEYRDRFPELADDRAALIELLSAERALRRRHGGADATDFAERFPELRDNLAAEPGGTDTSASSPTPPWRERHAATPTGLPAFAGYEVVREIGRGGMGVVYEARQLALDRVVALKVIRSGQHADAEELARFQAEAQTVARLRHPNIVQIYEVGEHDGRPFLALEYLDGGSLARRLAGIPWQAKDAAAMVEVLAHAVQHAHAQGVIHRDLKPANVLLQTLATDERGSTQIKNRGTIDPDSAIRVHPRSAVAIDAPKIVDFGLAKRIDLPGGQTGTGAVLGTPSYMAPEQARGDSRNVGPACDVYALGAILYELLTGRPPFRAPTPVDTILQVLHDEPVPPSRLQPAVPRDLETICLKCLQKESARRYASAAELAEDLGRFLRGEPIRARPVGALGRLWRWARRNPRVATLSAALLVVLTAGLVTVTALWLLAQERGDEAERQTLAASRARDEAERQKAAAVRERDESEKSFRQARETVDRFLTHVSQDSLLSTPRMKPLRRKLLADALEYYKGFVRQRGADPSLRNELARTHFRIGLLTSEVGTAEEALVGFRAAAAGFEALAAEHPKEVRYLHQLAGTRNNIANLHRVLGRLGESRAMLVQVRDTLERLAAERPGDTGARRELARAHSNLGNLEMAMGRFDDAQRSHDFAFALRAELGKGPLGNDLDLWVELARTHENLGRIRKSRGERRLALYSFRQAAGLRREIVARRSGDGSARRELAASLLLLGQMHAEDGRWDDARKAYAEGHEMLSALVREDPDEPGYRRELAQCYFDRGYLEHLAKRSAEAVPLLERAAELAGKLAADDPAATQYRADMARALSALGLAHAERSPHVAWWLHAQACAKFEALVSSGTEDVEHRAGLGLALHRLALTLDRLGRREQATAAAAQAIGHQRRAHEQAPRVVLWREELSGQLGTLERLLCKLGRGEDAAAVARRRQHLWPGDPEEQLRASCGLARSATLPGTRAEERERRSAEAVAALRSAVEAGLRNLQRLTAHPDLVVLRERDDFRTLLRDSGLEK